MKKYILLFFLFVFQMLFNSPVASGQVFKEEVAVMYAAQPGRVVELPGGDLIMQGMTRSDSVSNPSEFFLRLNAAGGVVWSHVFSDPTNASQLNGQMFLDSLGIIRSIGYKCTDIDTNGNIISRKTVTPAPGFAQNTGSGYKVLNSRTVYTMDYAYNVSASGSRVGVNSVASSQYQSSDFGFFRTLDNGFMMYGKYRRTTVANSASRFLMVKFDSAIQMQWNKIYEAPSAPDSTFVVSDMIATSTGEYLAAFVNSALTKAYAIKFDGTGNVIWGKNIAVYSLNFHVVEDPATGNYLFTMNMNQPLAFQPRNAGIMRTDTAFNILSSTYYFNTVSNYTNEGFSRTIPLSNGQFLLKTLKSYYPTQAYNIFMMRCNANLLTGCNDTAVTYIPSAFGMLSVPDTITVTSFSSSVSSFPATAAGVSNAAVTTVCQFPVDAGNEYNGTEMDIFPNPVQNSISVNHGNKNYPEAKFIIRNILGETVLESKEPKMNVSFLLPGIYLLEAVIDKLRMVKKMVKQ